jgi:hypothetical protein
MSKEKAEQMYASQMMNRIETGADPQSRTLLNHEDSPFLRLPIELRYEVYEYILGDLDVSYALGDTTTLASKLKLLTVCRQIHEDTYLLPFKLIAFEVLPHALKPFLSKLTDAQRNAITTFRVKQHTVKVAPKTKRQLRAMKEYAGLHELMRLRGLRRVVVWNWKVSADEVQERRDERSAVKWVVCFAGDRGVEVVYGDE